MNKPDDVPAVRELATLVELLRNPAAYPHPVEAVQVIQTHISYVLLAGRYAYKIKKPVDFGFLDFRTLRRRRHFCLREVQLNSRLSPGLYLGVVPIYRVKGGGVRVGPIAPETAEVAEYAVKMRRLPAEQMMDAMVDSARLEGAHIRKLAQRMARFHQTAPAGPGVVRFGSPQEIASAWEQNFEQTEAFSERTHSAAQRALLTEYVRTSLVRHHRLFVDRMRTGRIREGHGDLRTSAVCFDPSCPEGMCIFDCIEFNQRFRCCDVASETAFLAMDLELHGRADLARAWVDAYVTASEDEGVRSLLPFYGCYRAFVRGKVEGFRFQEEEVSARDRALALLLSRRAFALACRYADQDRPPIVLLMSGLSGTGKTTLAGAIASRLPFEVISSDLVRKELAGLAPGAMRKERFGDGFYAPERKQEVYEELYRQAASRIAVGRSVILDATFSQRAQRARAKSVADENGAYFFCIECRATEEAVRSRMDERERLGSASDARFDTYLQQRLRFEAIDEFDAWRHLVVNTSAPPEVSAAWIIGALNARLLPSGLVAAAPPGHPSLEAPPR